LPEGGTSGRASVIGGGSTVEWATSNFGQAGSWKDGDGDFSQPVDREISRYRDYLGDGDTLTGGVPADLGVDGGGIPERGWKTRREPRAPAPAAIHKIHREGEMRSTARPQPNLSLP